MTRTNDRPLVLYGVVSGLAVLLMTWAPFLAGDRFDPHRLASAWSAVGSDALLVSSAAALVLMIVTFLRATWSIWLNRLVAASALAVLALLAAHQVFDLKVLFVGRVVFWAVYPPVGLIASLQILAAREKAARRRRAEESTTHALPAPEQTITTPPPSPRPASTAMPATTSIAGEGESDPAVDAAA